MMKNSLLDNLSLDDKKKFLGIFDSLYNDTNGLELEDSFNKKKFFSKNLGQLQEYLNKNKIRMSDAELFDKLNYLGSKGIVRKLDVPLKEFYLTYFYLDRKYRN